MFVYVFVREWCVCVVVLNVCVCVCERVCVFVRVCSFVWKSECVWMCVCERVFLSVWCLWECVPLFWKSVSVCVCLWESVCGLWESLCVECECLWESVLVCLKECVCACADVWSNAWWDSGGVRGTNWRTDVSGRFDLNLYLKVNRDSSSSSDQLLSARHWWCSSVMSDPVVTSADPRCLTLTYSWSLGQRSEFTGWSPQWRSWCMWIERVLCREKCCRLQRLHMRSHQNFQRSTCSWHPESFCRIGQIKVMKTARG